jgi:hypothetical protein
MSRFTEAGFEVGRCIECGTELEVHRLSETEGGWYLCPADSLSDDYTVTEYADEVDPDDAEE